MLNPAHSPGRASPLLPGVRAAPPWQSLWLGPCRRVGPTQHSYFEALCVWQALHRDPQQQQGHTIPDRVNGNDEGDPEVNYAWKLLGLPCIMLLRPPAFVRGLVNPPGRECPVRWPNWQAPFTIQLFNRRFCCPAGAIHCPGLNLLSVPPPDVFFISLAQEGAASCGKQPPSSVFNSIRRN